MSPNPSIVSQWLAEPDHPSWLWQAGVLVLSLLVAWLLSHAMARRFHEHPERLTRFKVAIDSFQRVLTPLLSLFLVAIAVLVLGPWTHVGLLRIAMPLLLSFVLIRLVFYLLRKAFPRNGRVGGMLRVFEQWFAAIIWLGVAITLTGLGPDVLQFLEETTIPVGRHRESLLLVLQALIYVAFTVIIALWAAAMLEQRLMKLDTMHSSLRAVMARVVRAMLILLALLVSLSLVGIDLTVLSVFGGALGVGLGLGLQKLVSSYVSGFVILLERSLSIGDVVSIDKFSGQVEQINTRYTVLKASDGSETVIPNEMLVSSPVQNLSLSNRQARIATLLVLGHETDLDRLFPALLHEVSLVPRVVASPEPSAFLLRFLPDGLEIEVGFWIDDPELGKPPVLSAVNLALLSVLRSQGVRLAQPWVTSVPLAIPTTP
jgi:small-conductance mechanosensitive channel